MTKADLPDLRRLAANNQISYSGHAVDQMLDRDISQASVKDILSSPTNQLIETMGVTPEQLHADALENAPELKPAIIKGMTEMLADMGMPVEEMGLEVCGTHGTTAALALLNDAVKKGGVMASNHVGGLSGAFIPVSEDEGMIAAAEGGTLCLDKLEAMTCVCSVGLDMIAVPGDTTAATISAIIADEAAIGMVNSKTTAVRIIPAPGTKGGDMVEFGGLLGSAPIMRVNTASPAKFIRRGGRVPAPIHSLKN